MGIEKCVPSTTYKQTHTDAVAVAALKIYFGFQE